MVGESYHACMLPDGIRGIYVAEQATSTANKQPQMAEVGQIWETVMWRALPGTHMFIQNARVTYDQGSKEFLYYP